MTRIQRRRGVKLPEGTVYVGRPTLFGNPWTMRDAIAFDVPGRDRRAWLVAKYRDELTHLGMLSDYATVVSERRHDELTALGLPTMADYARHLLRGKDLACWCPLDEPCHADVLIERLSG